MGWRCSHTIQRAAGSLGPYSMLGALMYNIVAVYVTFIYWLIDLVTQTYDDRVVLHTIRVVVKIETNLCKNIRVTLCTLFGLATVSLNCLCFFDFLVTIQINVWLNNLAIFMSPSMNIQMRIFTLHSLEIMRLMGLV